MKRKIKEKARDIKLVAMDVDGVLTEGDIIIMESGEEVKKWNVKDRIAIWMAQKAGFKLAWISGRKCRQVEKRSRELNIDAVYLEVMNKSGALDDIMKKFSLKEGELAYIGDDLVDIPAMKKCGLASCPADAVDEVKAIADYVTKADGGRGVFREVFEIIMKAQGRWEQAVKSYTESF